MQSRGAALRTDSGEPAPGKEPRNEETVRRDIWKRTVSGLAAY
jgi:hypothetical protein